jgi:hypothetical protein
MMVIADSEPGWVVVHFCGPGPHRSENWVEMVLCGVSSQDIADDDTLTGWPSWAEHDREAAGMLELNHGPNHGPKTG